MRAALDPLVEIIRLSLEYVPVCWDNMTSSCIACTDVNDSPSFLLGGGGGGGGGCARAR